MQKCTYFSLFCPNLQTSRTPFTLFPSVWEPTFLLIASRLPCLSARAPTYPSARRPTLPLLERVRRHSERPSMACHPERSIMDCHPERTLSPPLPGAPGLDLRPGI
jgi:hypothetical protein